MKVTTFPGLSTAVLGITSRQEGGGRWRELNLDPDGTPPISHNQALSRSASRVQHSHHLSVACLGQDESPPNLGVDLELQKRLAAIQRLDRANHPEGLPHPLIVCLALCPLMCTHQEHPRGRTQGNVGCEFRCTTPSQSPAFLIPHIVSPNIPETSLSPVQARCGTTWARWTTTPPPPPPVPKWILAPGLTNQQPR